MPFTTEGAVSCRAVEPGEAMAAELHRVLPDVPIVPGGDGNALPLADSSHDLVTYAQSWQRTDTSRSVPEALRALRPSGALAIWWNTTAFDVTWIRAQHERIARHCGVPARAAVRPGWSICWSPRVRARVAEEAAPQPADVVGAIRRHCCGT
jgi:hypothetical protein